MRNITVAVNDKTYHDIRVWCANFSADDEIARKCKSSLPIMMPAYLFSGFLAK